ncbi:transport protein sec61 subunit gamma [Stemphylium lycopersici]|uniref:Transport protein sec61 subunit gamma n=1 Tax=Stemphylium lycopersici TaxID=183478 RepID=A0A364N1I1_STELY|nr:transport protein sec61 subunit gamma [Stemphylium lycopersici]RAR09215.1 transport protein sec61 subunit gamma [Stemphylium lycopersici]
MENVKEFAEYAMRRTHVWGQSWLTTAQYASRVPQGGHSFHEPLHQYDARPYIRRHVTDHPPEPDKKEFIRISQAVGIGFLIMGVIGYVVKLVHIPVNNILVGGS